MAVKRIRINESDFEDWEDDFDYEDYDNSLFYIAIDIGSELEKKYGYDIECQSVVPYGNYEGAQFNYIVDGEGLSADVKLNPPYDPSTQYNEFLEAVEGELQYMIDFGYLD